MDQRKVRRVFFAAGILLVVLTVLAGLTDITERVRSGKSDDILEVICEGLVGRIQERISDRLRTVRLIARDRALRLACSYRDEKTAKKSLVEFLHLNPDISTLALANLDGGGFAIAGQTFSLEPWMPKKNWDRPGVIGWKTTPVGSAFGCFSPVLADNGETLGILIALSQTSSFQVLFQDASRMIEQAGFPNGSVSWSMNGRIRVASEPEAVMKTEGQNEKGALPFLVKKMISNEARTGNFGWIGCSPGAIVDSGSIRIAAILGCGLLSLACFAGFLFLSGKAAPSSARETIELGEKTLRISVPQGTSFMLREENRQDLDAISFSVSEEDSGVFLAHPMRKTDFSLIYRVGLISSSLAEVDEVMSEMLDEILQVLPVRCCSIVLEEAASGAFKLVAVRWQEKGREAEGEVAFSKSILRYVMDKNESVLVTDAREDGRFQGESLAHMKTGNVVCVPLRGKQRIVGVLQVEGKEEEALLAEVHLRLLNVIGNQMGLSIENAMLMDEKLRLGEYAAVGRAMVSLAHDIRNILATLIGSLKIVEDGVRSNQMETVEKGWDLASLSGRRITRLVGDMVNFSKKVALRSRVGDICRIAEDTVKIFRDQAGERRISIKTDLPEVSIVFFFDSAAIMRVLSNLIINALDAVEDGKGMIVLKVREMPDGRRVRVDVTDNGSGIMKEDLPDVFDFYHTTKGEKGTGLGLAISKKLIEAHRGSIDVQSFPGKTTFSFFLPKRSDNPVSQ